MPHAIEFSRPAGNFREKFGLPEKKFLFLFIYDLNSYSERKNPRATLAAWRKAYGDSGETGLVIKVQNKADNYGDWSRLNDEVAGMPGVTLLSETLKRSDVYELQSACDSFVSLHRSEGFGLAVAESMYLGKPVISTDWSATAEFVNSGNGCPARCNLIALERTVGPYEKGQIWADADVDHAAWLMKQLSSDPALCERLGTAARRTIEERFSPAVIGRRYRRRLDAIATWYG
jgi:glycosyltransferase involved in cell wall biosynthesis